jgi:tetratricopeptide (TPR) repeat protein
LGANHPLTAFARSQTILFSPATTQQIQQASQDIQTAVNGDHPCATDLMFQAVSHLLDSGDDEAALTALFQVMGVDRKRRDGGKFIRTSDFSPASQQIIRSGRLQDYQPVARAAYERVKAKRGPNYKLSQSMQMLLILNLQETKHYAEAEWLCQDSLQRRIESFGPSHFRTIECCIHLQKLYWELKCFPEVQAIGLEIESRIANSDADPSVLGDFLNLTASTLTHCQFPDDAIRLLETATTLLQPAEAWSILLSTQTQLADIHYKHQRYPQALTAIHEAQSILEKHADAHATLYPVATLLHAHILRDSGQPEQAKNVLEKALQALTSISDKPATLAPFTEMLTKLSPP